MNTVIATVVVLVLLVAGIVTLAVIIRSVPGIRDLFVKLFHGLGQALFRFSDWLYSQSKAANESNGNIQINKREARLLLERLTELYDFVKVGRYGVVTSGVFCLFIEAHDLVEKYKKISVSEATDIITMLVESLFFEVREGGAQFYIHSAGANGFYLLMPLTPLGERNLNRIIEKDMAAQEAMRQKQESHQSGPLMKEIPIPRDERSTSIPVGEIPLSRDDDKPCR